MEVQNGRFMRRWLQFGLGTMFLAITIFAAWLAWEMKWIRDRKALILRIEASGGKVTTVSDNVEWAMQIKAKYKPFYLPWWRRVLGDEAVEGVCVWDHSSEALEEALRLFPEAEVWMLCSEAPTRPHIIRRIIRDRGDFK